ncbi:MAG: hypothetical protein JO196_19680 [Hyphomicrobiales bacterium]|nr:hypothetical protein [Hyphomicrobiales bacterium]
MGEEILGIEKSLIVLLRPGIRHDLTGRKGHAVTRHDAAIKSLRNRHERKVFERVDDVEKRDNPEGAGRNDLSLISGFPIRRDQATIWKICESIKLTNDTDLVRRDADHARFEHGDDRRQYQKTARNLDLARPLQAEAFAERKTWKNNGGDNRQYCNGNIRHRLAPLPACPC